MARSSVLLVVLCTLFIVNYAQQGQSAGKGEGCLKNGKTFYPGEVFTIAGQCNQYTCEQNGAISALTCALSRLPQDSPCHFSEIDLTKNYPDCCPQVVCPPGQSP